MRYQLSTKIESVKIYNQLHETNSENNIKMYMSCISHYVYESYNNNNNNNNKNSTCSFILCINTY